MDRAYRTFKMTALILSPAAKKSRYTSVISSGCFIVGTSYRS